MNINSWIIIGQALICAALVIIIMCQRIKRLKECDALMLALEDEHTLREVESACSKIVMNHQKQQAEKEIKKLEDALHASEKKRKELCARLRKEDAE